jgi:hypothetical protein
VLSPTTIQRLTQPTLTAQGQRAPGLRLADRRVMALLAALCLFLHLPEGFRNRQRRTHVAALLGENLQQYSAAKMSYDLRRLRLKGLLYRKAGSTRCHLTPYGLKVSLFLTRLHARLLRPGLCCLGTRKLLLPPSSIACRTPPRRSRNPTHARKGSPPCQGGLKNLPHSLRFWALKTG